jgi:hypothetical protein
VEISGFVPFQFTGKDENTTENVLSLSRKGYRNASNWDIIKFCFIIETAKQFVIQVYYHRLRNVLEFDFTNNVKE